MLQKERKEFFSTGEIAKILRVTRMTVYRWVKSGNLKAFQTPGGNYRILQKDFTEFLDKFGMEGFLSSDSLKALVRILVVDDEPEMVEIIKSFIENSRPNFHVVGATSGFEAGQLLGSFRPDIVILDLIMPGVDGFSVCRQIMADPRTGGTKIIAMTAHSSEENLERIKKEGASAVFVKPFNYKELLATIEKLVES